MGKWRDETKTLVCGCKIGRSASGMWFYDFICEEHIPKVQENGKFSLKKSEEFTEEMNKIMKEELKKKREALKELSETEKKTYDIIKEKGEIPIVDLPEKCRGAVGKLMSKKLIERFKRKHTWKRKSEWGDHLKEVYKTTNWVKIKE